MSTILLKYSLFYLICLHCAAEKPVFNKLSKNQTCFPSVSQEFHGSIFLDEIFERAIIKHDPSLAITTSGKCSKHNSSIQNDSLTSMEDSWVDLGQDDVTQTDQSPSNSPEIGSKHVAKKSECGYSDLFGSKEELINLICQEGMLQQLRAIKKFLVVT